MNFNELSTYFQQQYCPNRTIREVRAGLSAFMADMNKLDHYFIVNDENPNHDPNNGRFIAVGGAKFYPDKAKELGKQADPADKGKRYTQAGRSYEKHAPSKKSKNFLDFGEPKGSPEQKNKNGQFILGKILDDPNLRVFNYNHNRYGGVFDAFTDNGNGRGARFNEQLTRLICFLDPIWDEHKETYKKYQTGSKKDEK